MIDYCYVLVNWKTKSAIAGFKENEEIRVDTVPVKPKPLDEKFPFATEGINALLFFSLP